MIITRLLKYFKVDLSDESVVAPSIDIDCILLKRMQVGTRAHAQAPHVQSPPHFAPDSSSSSIYLYSAILNQMNTLSLSSSATAEKILASLDDFWNEY